MPLQSNVFVHQQFCRPTLVNIKFIRYKKSFLTRSDFFEQGCSVAPPPSVVNINNCYVISTPTRCYIYEISKFYPRMCLTTHNLASREDYNIKEQGLAPCVFYGGKLSIWNNRRRYHSILCRMSNSEGSLFKKCKKLDQIKNIGTSNQNTVSAHVYLWISFRLFDCSCLVFNV